MNAKHLNTYVLIVFAVLLSGCFDSNESGFSGTWQDTSGMNIRIEVKENNLLVIHIPQPRSDGRGTTGMDLDIRGSYSALSGHFEYLVPVSRMNLVRR